MVRSRFTKLDEGMQELVRGVFLAFAIKILGAFLVFIFNIVLARLLGASGAGVYFLALSITTIASIISRVGLDNTLLRFIAAESSEGNWSAVKGVYLKSIAIVIPLSIFISIILIQLAPRISLDIFNKPELEDPLRWMAFAILPLSMLSLYTEMLKGLNKISFSLSLQSFFLPIINLIVLVFLANKFENSSASISYLIATTCTAMMGGWFWYSHGYQNKPIKAYFSWKKLKESCLPNYGVALLHKAILRWLPLLILGYWSSTIDIGLYSASSRTAMLVSFILLAMNSVVAPRFATLYRQNNIAGLQKMTRQTTWLTSLVALFIVLPLVIFPEYIMGIFGSEFKKGSSLLIILGIGQFINVMFGPVGYLLLMTGHEAEQKNSVLISAILLFVLLLILIPLYGGLGAAIASVASGTLFCFISFLYVKKILGFSTFLSLNWKTQ